MSLKLTYPLRGVLDLKMDVVFVVCARDLRLWRSFVYPASHGEERKTAFCFSWGPPLPRSNHLVCCCSLIICSSSLDGDVRCLLASRWIATFLARGIQALSRFLISGRGAALQNEGFHSSRREGRLEDQLQSWPLKFLCFSPQTFRRPSSVRGDRCPGRWCACANRISDKPWPSRAGRRTHGLIYSALLVYSSNQIFCSVVMFVIHRVW